MGRALVVALALATLVGCGGADSPRPTLSDAEVAAVLEGTAENTDFLVRTEEELVAKCMMEQGFRYQPDTQAVGAAGSPFAAAELPLAEARVGGYGLAALREQADSPAPNVNADYAKSLSPEARQRFESALFGGSGSTINVDLEGQTVSTPTDGCISQARVDLYGDLEQWLRLDYVANNVLSEASLIVESDDGLISAQKSWSQCMTKAGYDFDGPRAARERAVRLYETLQVEDARSQEIAIAVADATCRGETSLPSALKAAQARAAARTVSDRQGDLLAATEMRRAAAAKAVELLGTAGGSS